MSKPSLSGSASLQHLCVPELLHVARNCRKEGGTLYIVGGAVRDALMDKPVTDFDVEVFGLGAEQLQTALSTLGPVNSVGRSFGIFKVRGHPYDFALPRTETKAGTGHRGFTVQLDPELPVAKAAQRRDFTVNAIYFDPLKEQLIDPLNGMGDLQARRLRHCSSQFGEDPLRVLRAMQFAARFAATLDYHTLALCRQLTPEGLSGERFREEWEKLLLKGMRPSMGLEVLKHCGWLKYFPELAAIDGCPQDPQWHPEGDVWRHTLHCLDAYARQRTGNAEEDRPVAWAVLCHDLGKPATTLIDANGRLRSNGHEKAGLAPSQRLLEQLRLPRKLIDTVRALVETHMRPLALYQNRSSAAAIRRLAHDCRRLDWLLRVVQADSAGRPPLPDNSGPALEWLRQQARQLKVERERPQPLIRGRDLLGMGLAPGPTVGDWVRQAYEAQLGGLFESQAGGIAWLRQQSGFPQSSGVPKSVEVPRNQSPRSEE
jgi:tRNA nucleotidyltransferase (CCA-adding enzyme)